MFKYLSKIRNGLLLIRCILYLWWVIPVFKFSELQTIHLEITNNCQASCPMCTRNIHGGLPNPLMTINSWSLDTFKRIMTREVLDQVSSYYFCGNFGDPILNNELIEMCAYSSEIAPNTPIRIHTNGGARNTDWWTRLVKALPKDHLVIFAIDGLEGTHELYRIGTTFSKVIENAKAFIDAGGNAEWAYIRFKHNEHQVEEAKALASQLGFNSFTMKDSSRFMLDKQFPVYNKQGETTHYIEPSTYTELKFIDKNVIENYKAIVKASEIKCQALELKEIYIDAFGKVFPCCWIAMIPYTPTEKDNTIASIRYEISKQYNALLEDLGGIDAIDASVISIRNIVDSPAYQTVWNKYWDSKGLITCARACGVMPENNISKPSDQFITRSQLV